MKRFIAAATLILGIFSGQAQAYQPQYGDTLVVYYWYCSECQSSYKQNVVEPHRYSDPPPQQAHPYGCHGNKKLAHKWERYSNREVYIFSNGQWRRS